MLANLLDDPAALVFVPALAGLAILLLIRHLQRGRGTVVIPSPTTPGGRRALVALVAFGFATMGLAVATLAGGYYDWPAASVQMLGLATKVGAAATALAALMFGWQVG